MSLETANRERMKALYWLIKVVNSRRQELNREGWEETPKESLDDILMNVKDFLANRMLEPNISKHQNKNVKELVDHIEKTGKF